MASIDSLPTSITRRLCDTIVARTPRDALPALATVSRAWQKAFERHTFHALYLSSPRLDQLEEIVTRQRQRYLQVITLHIALASYDRHQRNDKESAEDGNRTTRILTSTMQDFFGTLSRWRVDDGPPEGIHVELLVESPSDEAAGSHYSRTSRSPTTTRRARSSVVRLDIPSHALPQTPLVSALTCSGRHIELSSIVFLISRLPRLRLLDTEIEHDTSDDRDIEQRREFVLGLSHYAPKVTDLRLRRPMNSYGSQKMPYKEARALFHSLLLQYTQRCTELTFDDCVDIREFLAPFQEGDGDGDFQHYWWPRLRRLHMRNSYMLRRPYMRVNTRASALKHVHEVVLMLGRAVRFMPSVTNVRVRQYVLTGASLEQIIVQYEADERTSKIFFDGIEPIHSAVETWKASIWAIRGVELEVNVHIGRTYEGDAMA